MPKENPNKFSKISKTSKMFIKPSKSYENLKIPRSLLQQIKKFWKFFENRKNLVNPQNPAKSGKSRSLFENIKSLNIIGHLKKSLKILEKIFQKSERLKNLKSRVLLLNWFLREMETSFLYWNSPIQGKTQAEPMASLRTASTPRRLNLC